MSVLERCAVRFPSPPQWERRLRMELGRGGSEIRAARMMVAETRYRIPSLFLR
jgi:hypothetical protein